MIPFLKLGRAGCQYIMAGGELSDRIVLTNGCFDVLHVGHLQCLQYAKSQGGMLIVAVNDDEGVRALKGEGRPVNCLKDRMEMLAALRCVDMVVSFKGTRATELFKVLRPDVYVKGGDYDMDTLDKGEKEALLSWDPRPEILFFPFKRDVSTTKILARMKG
ncbi:MAG: adenylyltransferase/cytidyltransferase family protein [Clostridia bacterium]|nr:adenylyltransferase/cytidyltransferase family protein [Clostridia bacterium]